MILMIQKCWQELETEQSKQSTPSQTVSIDTSHIEVIKSTSMKNYVN